MGSCSCSTNLEQMINEGKEKEGDKIGIEKVEKEKSESSCCSSSKSGCEC